MANVKIFRTFTENLQTIFRNIILHEIDPKSFSQGFPLIFKFSENSPRISREIMAHEFHQKHFPEFYNFLKFSDNFETILVIVRFQFRFATESIGQNGTILPMISQSNCEKAGQDE